MFCPECGSILRPKDKGGKKVLFCSCGYSKAPAGEANTAIKETVPPKKKIEVIENIEMNPKMRTRCEKCGHTWRDYD